MSLKHEKLLDRIQSFFGVGKVYIRGNNAVYRVTAIADLINVIIPHFNEYPLLSTKVVVFTLWVQAVELFKIKSHLTENGFMLILSIYAAIGNGASTLVMSHFPNLVAAALPDYKTLLSLRGEHLENWWVSGYLTLYCNFQLDVLSEGWKLEIYHKLRHLFSLSRDISELYIIKLIAEHLGANVFIRKDGNRVDVNISNLESCMYLIRFLDMYPLQSSKHHEFLIWREFVRSSYNFNQSKNMMVSLDNSAAYFISLVEKLKDIRDDTASSKD